MSAPSEDPAIHSAFKTAASTLTQLYVTSLRGTKRAREAGYAAALEDIAALVTARRGPGNAELADEILAFCQARMDSGEPVNPAASRGAPQGAVPGLGLAQQQQQPLRHPSQQAPTSSTPASPPAAQLGPLSLQSPSVATVQNSPSLLGQLNLGDGPGFTFGVPFGGGHVDTLKRRHGSNGSIPFSGAEFSFLGRTFGFPDPVTDHSAKRRRRMDAQQQQQQEPEDIVADAFVFGDEPDTEGDGGNGMTL